MRKYSFDDILAKFIQNFVWGSVSVLIMAVFGLLYLIDPILFYTFSAVWLAAIVVTIIQWLLHKL